MNLHESFATRETLGTIYRIFESSMFLCLLFEQGETESGWQPTMRPTFLWPAPRMTWRIGWRRSAGSSGHLLVEVSQHTSIVFISWITCWLVDVNEICTASSCAGGWMKYMHSICERATISPPSLLTMCSDPRQNDRMHPLCAETVFN